MLIEPRRALSDHTLPWRLQGDENGVRNAIVKKKKPATSSGDAVVLGAHLFRALRKKKNM